MSSKRVKECAEFDCQRMITRDAERCGSCAKRYSVPWNKGIKWPEDLRVREMPNV